MYKIKTMENMVLNVLISNPDARDDDMRLYYYVCRDCISETHGNTHLSFEEVMTNYKELGCPGFESVRRTRQKIQAILPELGCSPTVRRRRNKGVIAYTNYDSIKKKLLPILSKGQSLKQVYLKIRSRTLMTLSSVSLLLPNMSR